MQTPSEHPDRANLQAAVEWVDRSALAMNETIRRIENEVRIAKIEKLFPNDRLFVRHASRPDGSDELDGNVAKTKAAGMKWGPSAWRAGLARLSSTVQRAWSAGEEHDAGTVLPEGCRSPTSPPELAADVLSISSCASASSCLPPASQSGPSVGHAAGAMAALQGHSVAADTASLGAHSMDAAPAAMAAHEHRRYIMESDVVLTTVDGDVAHERYAFLLNDVLLLAKPRFAAFASSKSQPTYALKERVWLSDAWLCHCAPRDPREIVLGWAGQPVAVRLATPSLRAAWYDALAECVREERMRAWQDERIQLSVFEEQRLANDVAAAQRPTARAAVRGAEQRTILVSMADTTLQAVVMALSRFNLPVDDLPLYRLVLQYESADVEGVGERRLHCCEFPGAIETLVRADAAVLRHWFVLQRVDAPQMAEADGAGAEVVHELRLSFTRQRSADSDADEMRHVACDGAEPARDADASAGGDPDADSVDVDGGADIDGGFDDDDAAIGIADDSPAPVGASAVPARTGLAALLHSPTLERARLRAKSLSDLLRLGRSSRRNAAPEPTTRSTNARTAPTSPPPAVSPRSAGRGATLAQRTQSSPVPARSLQPSVTSPLAGHAGAARKLSVSCDALSEAEQPGGGTRGHFFHTALLDMTSADQQALPPLLTELACELYERAPRTKLVFRRGGNERLLHALIDALERGFLIEASSVPALTMAGLFKEFLRRMPDCVFTCALYDEFVAVTENAGFSREQRVNALRMVLDKLPRPNQQLVCAVCHILHAVAAQSEANGMTARSLAVCLGNCLLWSAGSTSGSVFVRREVPPFIEFVITHCPRLFGPFPFSRAGPGHDQPAAGLDAYDNVTVGTAARAADAHVDLDHDRSEPRDPSMPESCL